MRQFEAQDIFPPLGFASAGGGGGGEGAGEAHVIQYNVALFEGSPPPTTFPPTTFPPTPATPVEGRRVRVCYG